MHLTKSELNSYIFGKTLGKGTFGKVKLATHKNTGQLVAIKILQKAKIKDVTDVERVSRQLHILKITQHSSIAQMYEIVQTELNIFIVMEYAPLGEFFDFIMDGKIKNQQEAHHYFVQIVAGLEYLHKLKISHRDIKPQNMLLDSNNRLKIVDFGLSNMYKQGQMLLTACGSPCYASPEMIKGEQYDPQLTDVWSLGVVLFSMIFAKLPFQDDNTSILYGKIKSGLYVIDKKISPELRDLLSKLLCIKPKNRYNIQQIKQHPWFKIDRVCKCNGIIVGYQNVPLDNKILEELQILNYSSSLAKKYLENNIRNQTTTAYYLLMKKKFRKGDPSEFDICNENFNKKLLVPKMSKINIAPTNKKIRHQSMDITTPPNKQIQTIQLEESLFPTKNRNKLSKVLNKQRICYSQMKAQQYDDSKFKASTIYKSNDASIFKKVLKDRYDNKFRTKQLRQKQRLSRSKRSENSQKSLLQQRKSIYKNVDKQHNISINVYINNSKILTPTKRKKTSSSKLQKQLLQIKNTNNTQGISNFTNKRFKTQFTQKQKKQSNNKASRRYENSTKLEIQSKSLQKSHDIQYVEQSFWKKKTANGIKDRDYTTEVKKDRHSKLSKW